MAVTEQELAWWERLAKEAAPGPWKQHGDTGLVSQQSRRSDLPALEIVDTTTNANRGIENARFIAASREAVPVLVAEVRRLLEEVERFKDAKEREREACATFLEAEASDIEAGKSDFDPKALSPYSAAGEALRKAARVIRARAG